MNIGDRVKAGDITGTITEATRSQIFWIYKVKVDPEYHDHLPVNPYFMGDTLVFSEWNVEPA